MFEVKFVCTECELQESKLTITLDLLDPTLTRVNCKIFVFMNCIKLSTADV